MCPAPLPLFYQSELVEVRQHPPLQSSTSPLICHQSPLRLMRAIPIGPLSPSTLFPRFRFKRGVSSPLPSPLSSLPPSRLPGASAFASPAGLAPRGTMPNKARGGGRVLFWMSLCLTICTSAPTGGSWLTPLWLSFGGCMQRDVWTRGGRWLSCEAGRQGGRERGKEGLR